MWDINSLTVPMGSWQVVGMILQSLLFALFLLPTMMFIALTVDPVASFSTKVCRCDEPAPAWRKAYRTGNAVIVALINEIVLVVIMWVALAKSLERN